MLEFDAFYVLEFALSFGEYPMPRFILGSKANQRIQKPVSLFTLSLFISFGQICCSFAAGLARPLYTLLIRAFYIGFRISSVDASSILLFCLRFTISDTLILLTPPRPIPHFSDTTLRDFNRSIPQKCLFLLMFFSDIGFFYYSHGVMA